MSAGSGRVTLFWAGEEREFRLSHRQLFDLQGALDCGPEELFFRIGNGRWSVRDLRVVILNGLVGGGMKQPEAEKLLKASFDDTALMPHKDVALKIIKAVLVQPQGDEVGKAQRGREQNPAESPSATESDRPSPSA